MFRDRTDLRLSARFVFRDVCEQKGQPEAVLPNRASLSAALSALFTAASDSSSSFSLLLTEVRSVSFPVDESAFVQIAERIYSSRNAQAPDSADAADQNSLSRLFVQELRSSGSDGSAVAEPVGMLHQSRQSASNRSRCISQRTFFASCREGAVSHEASLALWHTLVAAVQSSSQDVGRDGICSCGSSMLGVDMCVPERVILRSMGFAKTFC